MAEKKSFVDTLTKWAGVITTITGLPIGAAIAWAWPWVSQPHGWILIGLFVLFWSMLIFNVTLICKWISYKRIKDHEQANKDNRQAKAISGKWKQISQADVIKTGFYITFKPNGVLEDSLRSKDVTWQQNGHNEFFITLRFTHPREAFDRLNLSEDGKTLRGINSEFQQVVYTYVSE